MKNHLINGVSSGIGLTLAQTLLESGNDVFVRLNTNSQSDKKQLKSCLIYSRKNPN